MIPKSIESNPELRPLEESDYAALDARWVTRELADAALLRRVTSLYGAELVGQTGRAGDYSGIYIPYVWPGTEHVVMERLRRDHPDLEAAADGQVKPRRKYLSPPGGGNRIYLPTQTELAQLSDVSLPLVIVEGEFKTLALWRLAWHGVGEMQDSPAFLPVGLQGVWNWRGVVGKATDQDGARVDVKGPVADLARIIWTDRRVVVLFDADVDKNYRVAVAREQLTAELEERGAHVAWFTWPSNTPAAQKGIDDFLAANGPEQAIRLLAKAKVVTKRRRPVTVAAAVRGDEWKGALLRGDKGVKPLLANAMTALRRSPEWANALAFNAFSMRTEILEGTPWRSEPYLWSDADDTWLAEWLQRQGIEVTVSAAGQAAEAVAREREHHPVRDYFDGLTWDQTPRIDQWLTTYFGTPDTPYARAVGACWLVSAVARVMKPGCQADYTLILQGEQGIQKSSALRVLGGEWFTDDIEELGSKDSAMQLLGIWIVELGELSQIVGQRAEMERIKSFLPKRIDHFRPPYGRRTADFPRQCVFAGSTNAETYFRDETGNRRFWPVACPRAADVEALARDRDQLWAEAWTRYQAGAKWWFDDAELVTAAQEEQDLRYQRDPWDRMVWDYVIGAREAWKTAGDPVEAFTVTIEELLQKACKKDLKDWTRQDSNRICSIMRVRGLVYKRERLYGDDGEPLRDPRGRARLEYHFRWP